MNIQIEKGIDLQENEVIEMVEHYCQSRKIDCEKFEEDLTIKIKKEMNPVGFYKPYAKIVQLKWEGEKSVGILFHELLHHESAVFRNSAVHHENEENKNIFFDIVKSVLEDYCVYKGYSVYNWYDEDDERHIFCKKK